MKRTIRGRLEREVREAETETERIKAAKKGIRLKEKEEKIVLGQVPIKRELPILTAIKTPITKEAKEKERRKREEKIELPKLDKGITKTQEQMFQEIYVPKPTFRQKLQAIYSPLTTVQEGEGFLGRTLAKVLPDVKMPKLVTETGIPTRWKDKKAEDILRKGFKQKVKEAIGLDIRVQEARLIGERLGVGVAVTRAVRKSVTGRLREESKQLTQRYTAETQKRVETRIKKEVIIKLQADVTAGKITVEEAERRGKEKIEKIAEQESKKAQVEFEKEMGLRQEVLTKGHEERVKKLIPQAEKQLGLEPGGEREVFMVSGLTKKLGLEPAFKKLILTGRKYESLAEEAKGPLTKKELAVQATTPWMKEQILTGKITPFQPESEKVMFTKTSRAARLAAGAIRKPEKVIGYAALGATLAVSVPFVSAAVSTAALTGSKAALVSLYAGKAAGVSLTGLYAYGIHQKIKTQPTEELKYITVGEELSAFTGLAVGGKIGFDYLRGARYQIVADMAKVGLKAGGRKQALTIQLLKTMKGAKKVKVTPQEIQWMEVTGMTPKIAKYLRKTLPKEKGVIGGTTIQTAYFKSLPKGYKPGDIDKWTYFPRIKGKLKATQARKAGFHVETFTPKESKLRLDIMSGKSLRIWESVAAKTGGAKPVVFSYHTMAFYRANPFQVAGVKTPSGIKIVPLTEQFGRKFQGFFTAERTKDYPHLSLLAKELQTAAQQQLKTKTLFGKTRLATTEFALQQFQSVLASGFISPKRSPSLLGNVMAKISSFTVPKKQVRVEVTGKRIGRLTPSARETIKWEKILVKEFARVGLKRGRVIKPYKLKTGVLPYSYEYKPPIQVSIKPTKYKKPKYGLPIYPYEPVYKGTKQAYKYKPTQYNALDYDYKYKTYDYGYKYKPYGYGYKYKPYDYGYKYKSYDYGYKYKSYDYKPYPYKAPPPMPLWGGMQLWFGEGIFKRQGKVKKEFRYTGDFMAHVLSQYGLKPLAGRIYSGQERRFLIRGRGRVINI